MAPTGQRRASIYVTAGRIVAIGDAGIPARQRVDASGLIALPGFVDSHVHLTEPADPSREDWLHGTSAAAANGVTAIVEHTHGAPVRDRAEVETKLAWVAGRSHVDYALAAHAWPDRIDQLEGAWSAGAAFVKVFTCTTHGVPGFDAPLLSRLFAAAAALHMPCLVHCEDEELVAEAEARLRAQHREDAAVLPEWRSRRAEEVAVERILALARATNASVTIAHATRVEVVDVIAAARREGADVVAESCRQYFSLFEDEVASLGGLRKFTPPARARNAADQSVMWAALQDGRIDHISTDHAPATLAQKPAGGIWDVHFGLPGLNTTSSLLIDAALQGVVTLDRVAQAYAEVSARRYGLIGKGRLEAGADADIVIVGPGTTRTLTNEDVPSKAGWTPYAGRSVRGTVVATYLRGQPIFQHGRIGVPRGRFVAGSGAQAPASNGQMAAR